MVAKSGEDGFSLLNTEPFDLVVLDWMLPGRDGIEILKALALVAPERRCFSLSNF